MIVSDNGTELTSRVVLQWALEHGVEWHYITPGKPKENGFTEKLQRQNARRVFERALVHDLGEAQNLAAEWLFDYNHVRPHSSLNYLTPMEFLKQQEAGCARLLTVAPPASCCPQPPALSSQKDSTCRWYIIGGQVTPKISGSRMRSTFKHPAFG